MAIQPHDVPMNATMASTTDPGRAPPPSAGQHHQSRYVIERSRLEGEVQLLGAKNSVLKLLSASLLSSEPIDISSFPATLLDVQVHVAMLRQLGKTCDLQDRRLVVREEQPLRRDLKWEGRSIRNTLLMLGALTTRFGAAAVPLPGGCKLGERKYDLHETVLRALGARMWDEDGMLHTEAPDGLKGADIHLPIRSTGATENAILCGTLARGVTRVWNPHIRPEILDLIRFLRGMGAQIAVHGQEHIEIKGVERLGGISYEPIADNMEALTWLIGATITRGDVEIANFPWNDLETPLIFLRESGARIFRSQDRAIVRGGTPYPVEISTGPYPGINSDMQPLFAVFGACARGESRIIDLRFPGRYRYAEELAKMGLQFRVQDNLLAIQGGARLQGAEVSAVDLRAGVAVALAGLVADGQTVISDAWQIERGYESFVTKLTRLGGKVSYA
jgi:UDP-N-acetylglucosamine 1-carboxyvinyltransferase